MLVHADVLVAERDVVPRSGLRADVGDTINSGAVQELACLLLGLKYLFQGVV